MLEVKGLCKDFGGTRVLQGVDFQLGRGERCAIQGASGSGKSTFLHLLAALDRPLTGSIHFGGQDIARLDDKALAEYRNRSVGLVFQFHFLLSSMSCLDNILLPSELSRLSSKERKSVRDHVLDLGKEIGVDHLFHKYPFQVSGGEQQRMSLIRALSMKPQLLLCDEPTGNLDSKNSSLVTDLIFKLAQENNSSLIVVTHDEKMAQRFQKIMKMEDGKLS